jgi:hypothetical protein
MKLVTMYDQEKAHRLVRATRLGVKQAGRLIRDMSADVKLRQAQEVAAVTDGAEWIANLIQANLPAPTTVILDYFHASQHVHQTRRTVFGEENGEGNQWVDRLLHDLCNGGWDDAWEMLVQTRSRLRSRVKRKSLDDLMGYLIERREKVDYASFRAAGYDIGSGPTESMCKSLSRRMKGIGMRWTGKNAESMVALESLHQRAFGLTTGRLASPPDKLADPCRYALSIALTVSQPRSKNSATCLIGSTLQSRATLSASRRVTRAYGSSQSRCSSFGPHSGQATRQRCTSR